MDIQLSITEDGHFVFDGLCQIGVFRNLVTDEELVFVVFCRSHFSPHDSSGCMSIPSWGKPFHRLTEKYFPSLGADAACQVSRFLETGKGENSEKERVDEQKPPPGSDWRTVGVDYGGTWDGCHPFPMCRVDMV
jgi:hypothetical protein